MRIIAPRNTVHHKAGVFCSHRSAQQMLWLMPASSSTIGPAVSSIDRIYQHSTGYYFLVRPWDASQTGQLDMQLRKVMGSELTCDPCSFHHHVSGGLVQHQRADQATVAIKGHTRAYSIEAPFLGARGPNKLRSVTISRDLRVVNVSVAARGDPILTGPKLNSYRPITLSLELSISSSKRLPENLRH